MYSSAVKKLKGKDEKRT